MLQAVVIVHSWVDGVLLSLAAGLLSAFGLTLQRKAWLQRAAEKAKTKALRQQRGRATQAHDVDPCCACCSSLQLFGPTGQLWLLGSALYIASGMCDGLSYFFASNAVLAVLACTHPVLVSLGAWLMLGERFNLYDILGSVGCVAGAAGILVFAPRQSTALRGHFHHLLWDESRCRYYLVFMMALVALLVAVHFLPAQFVRRNKSDSAAWLRSVSLPMLVASVGTLGKLWNVQLSIAVSEATELGNFSQLVAPVISTLSLLTLCALVCFVLTQRGIADPAMENHVFVPSCFAFSIVLQCSQSVVIGEFASSGTKEIVASFLSACVAVGGVFAMHAGRMVSPAPPEKPPAAAYGAL